jgi:hypothetical protein
MSCSRPGIVRSLLVSTIGTPPGSDVLPRCLTGLVLPLLGVVAACGSPTWANPLSPEPERPPAVEISSSPGKAASGVESAGPNWPGFQIRNGFASESGRRCSARLSLLLDRSFQDSERRRASGVDDLSRQLLSRLNAEAGRFQGAREHDLLVSRDPFDSVAEELRAEEAESILTRAFNRTLESQAELLARTSPGIREVLDWLEDFGGTGRVSRTAAGAEGSGAGRSSSAAESDPRIVGGRFRASFGLRIGAHPRLVLRSHLGGFRARVEVPPPGEPLRLTVERPLGVRGQIVLTSGFQGGGRDWASLGWTLRF